MCANLLETRNNQEVFPILVCGGCNMVGICAAHYFHAPNNGIIIYFGFQTSTGSRIIIIMLAIAIRQRAGFFFLALIPRDSHFICFSSFF